ncbi:30S ribosomal protein S6 [Desulfoluna spongiiphila]|uniref:Small ribosomal subunit protein bS6 n=1 Tax=Desulfoluna spongiiphila TaxID=419481 RepID=A0A1G5AGX6_9BACT|nr:30S ribosomal protein S6 [Desulfoluna spongiiphila]SCX77115.1 small subunit ribosomal protein S6 [Desulfoluna spongiiphila]VVS90599.1 translation elongation factor ef1b/ribosomal protein s6 [Desulfoluna spongiiphila]
MRRYETVFILDPDLGEEVRNQRYDKVKEIIGAYKGVLIEFDDWGVRKLAYDIRKKTRGQYVRVDYCGDGTLISELERTFRLDDKFLKFMTIILGDDVNPDDILAEKEQAEAAAAEAEAAPEAEVEAEKAEEAPAADAPAAEEKAEEPAEPETKEED